MKLTENFRLEEFVPPSIFHRYGSKAIWFIDPKMVDIAQSLRYEFDVPGTINNWHSGGQLMNRGYRTPGAEVGAYLSQHKKGCAIDISFEGISPDEVYDYVRLFWRALGVTAIEDTTYTPSWVHLDIRWTGGDELLIVKP
jgi:hypothetical protein